MGATEQSRVVEGRETTVESQTPEAVLALVTRLVMVIDELEGVGRYMRKPVFVAQLKEGVADGVHRSSKPFLTPAEASVETGDSPQFIAERAKEKVINTYGGPGNPKYDRQEIYAAIRERRWTSQKVTKKTKL